MPRGRERGSPIPWVGELVDGSNQTGGVFYERGSPRGQRTACLPLARRGVEAVAVAPAPYGNARVGRTAGASPRPRPRARVKVGVVRVKVGVRLHGRVRLMVGLGVEA